MYTYKLKDVFIIDIFLYAFVLTHKININIGKFMNINCNLNINHKQ